MIKIISLIFIFTMANYCYAEFAVNRPAAEICQEISKSIAKLNDIEKLKTTLEKQWSFWMAEDPEAATYIGLLGSNHLWTNRSLSTWENRKKTNACFLKIFKGISRNKLEPKDQLNLDLAIYSLNLGIESENFDGRYFVIHQMGGIHFEVIDLLDAAPKDKPSDFEDRIKRLRALPEVVNQTIEILKEGVKKKITPVKFLTEKIPQQIDEIIPAEVVNSPIYKNFLAIPNNWEGNFREQTLAEAKKVIESSVYPALKNLRDYLVKEYIPKCRKEIHWSSLPKGVEWYSYLAKKHTTTKLKPQEIHDLGLAEVKRLKTEMEKIKDQVKFKGNLKDFHEFLRTAPEFFFSKSKDLIGAYRDIAKRIDPELPRLFGNLPRLPYGVREMPLYKATSAPTAYYMPGSVKAGRAGFFEANTYDLNSRPKWEMEVLTLHEAVPGHHLQIAIAQELGDMPEFRKHEGYTAFTEGWGLYAEALGDDLGLYADPYSKYGQLSYEMWRAVRLVVDTGMHVKSWSKEKALDYFMEHVPKSKLQAENEIDRYIADPGQALAYKVGQLKFNELKVKAKKKLKDDFNIKKFHDGILRHGAIPLDILEVQFNDWLNKSDI